ncbi:hypothetical protein KBZ15_07280 [Cyanobium sp. BA20m-p-22]|uniref:hypothetical protein n=1 Tax=Cyanobium sp. BA20m-p-22 TaxID=2823704 RepID=UPI0020CFAA2F|nr:hypothetical protein [Cyanobium sp. BA20m-p-22]MCP9909707.1 hypothetical protein [Cyanobium sp. BA20m-p-22]
MKNYSFDVPVEVFREWDEDGLRGSLFLNPFKSNGNRFHPFTPENMRDLFERDRVYMNYFQKRTFDHYLSILLNTDPEELSFLSRDFLEEYLRSFLWKERILLDGSIHATITGVLW